MKKFEVGKRYGDNAVLFEIISRTEKTITYQRIHHAGKSNERRTETKKTKIYNWDAKEVFHTNHETVEA